MKFGNIFKDSNDINEKSVVGFISFAVMVVFAIVNMVAAFLGKDLAFKEYIYESFMIITLGSFGIAEVSKAIGARRDKKDKTRDTYNEDQDLTNDNFRANEP